MPFSKIRRYYFTVCALLFVLLFVLMLARTGWRLTPQALLSTVVGWLLLCAVIIGVVYLVVSRRKTKGNERTAGPNATSELLVPVGRWLRSFPNVGTTVDMLPSAGNRNL